MIEIGPNLATVLQHLVVATAVVCGMGAVAWAFVRMMK